MTHSLAGIEWHETNPILDNLITSCAELTLNPLSLGLEADVVKITQGEEHFVLKVWNKRSKPDILRQYRLLEALHLQRVQVSVPIACGRTWTGDSVLLTRYHGAALTKVSPNIFKIVASILADIHRLHPEKLGGNVLARCDFVEYFYSGIDVFPSMKEVLIRLIASQT